jgi:hypothetical protein
MKKLPKAISSHVNGFLKAAEIDNGFLKELFSLTFENLFV